MEWERILSESIKVVKVPEGIRKLVLSGENIYCTNNSTVAFIFDGSYYVIPYMRAVMVEIETRCRKADFCVMYSYDAEDYPKWEKERWFKLRNMALESYRQEHREECQKWCDEHHIDEIPETIMKNWLQIPDEGIETEGDDGAIRQPVRKKVDWIHPNMALLGKFWINNGLGVVVDRNGETYVFQACEEISSCLRAAGYKETSMWVPFSNGEEPKDPYYKSILDALKNT